MREKPNLADTAITHCLHDGYGLAVTRLAFLPVGNDARSWTYRADADDGSAYFVKVKRGPVYGPSLVVPHFLKEQGLRAVVAPLPARTLELSQPAGDFTLIVYPFISGRSGRAAGMSPHQWVALGAALQQLHAPEIAAGLAGQIDHETFAPKYSGVVGEVQAAIDANAIASPAAHTLARLWREKQAEISVLVRRADELGATLQAQPPLGVVCHTDIHTDNVMVDDDGRLWIVDWDAPLLAPKERDLMFVAGSARDGEHSANPFWQGYGRTIIDPVALAYYRYEWVVEEIGDYGERVFLTPDSGEATQAEAVREFGRLFEPGNVVAQAYAAEQELR